MLLLLLMGWGIRQGTNFLKLELPDFSVALPVLATFGLVLIVMEGALELNLDKSKIIIVQKATLGALFSLLLVAGVIAFGFHYYGGYGFRDSLINAIPFGIISSAIAIPSVSNLSQFKKEFIVYESSISDVLGVLFFNFIVLNKVIDFGAVVFFGFEIMVMMVVSIVATFGLSFLLGRIDHPVKFAPLILLVILIYAISEVFHLPALIFILIFGLAIGNLHLFEGISWMSHSNSALMSREVEKLKDLTAEGAFLLRSLFFILFGYLITTADIMNTASLGLAAAIVLCILVFRVLQLWISRVPIFPLLFVTPRGLITILLFMSIAAESRLDIINKSLILQVIVMTAIVMAVGLIFTPQQKRQKANEH